MRSVVSNSKHIYLKTLFHVLNQALLQSGMSAGRLFQIVEKTAK